MRARFDRGTLVLEASPELKDPSQIRGAAWDNDMRAWRVPAERYSELSVRLADEHVRKPDKLPGDWKLPALRWYQHVALERWRDAGRRGVIALPTGAGKTLVAIAAIAELGVPALVLVPTRILLDQWITAIARCWPHAVGRIGDGEHSIGPITVCTYSSAITWAPRIGDRFGLVVVDEAHHVGAWCPSEVLEMLIAPARMGVTAVPPEPGGALEDRVGPVIYTLGLDDLKGDSLAEFTHVEVPVALVGDEPDRYRRQRGTFADFYARVARQHRFSSTSGDGWNRFTQIAKATERGREALEAWRGYRSLIAYSSGKRAALRELLARHAGQRTLVFTADTATAYTIARELLVVPITHEIGRVEREQILARFRAGEVSVLVAAQVLDEGFDVPDAEIAIIVGGTASRRRQVQRVGRVLRPRDGKQAVIYELVVSETTEIDSVRKRRGGLESTIGRTIPTAMSAVGGAQ
jgi:superfamily II DNA or RNA helicase